MKKNSDLKSVLFCLFIILTVITFANEKQLSVNDLAPPIRLRGLDNKLVFIDTILKTKPIVISFFFVGCVNCKKEMPGLSSLKQKYNESVQFFIISTDTGGADVVTPYIEINKITILVLLDKYSDTARMWGVEQYPALFVIGRDGKIKYVSIGYHEDTVERLDKVLNKIK